MFCPRCGMSNVAAATACAGCREPLTPSARTRLPVAVYVAFGLLAVTYVLCGFLLANGFLVGQAGVNVAFVSAIAFAYAWKKLGKHPWAGAIIGLVAGYVGIVARAFLIAFAKGFLRARGIIG